MPSFGPVKINQQVEIEVVTNQSHKYRTKVENVSEQLLEILAPMEKGMTVPMPSGMSVRVSYFDDLAVYSLYAQVIRQRRGELATVILGSPTRFTRIQRRNYVRIDTSIEVEARKKNDGAEPGEKTPVSPENKQNKDLKETDKKVETEQKIEVRQIRDKFLRNNPRLNATPQPADTRQAAPNAEDTTEAASTDGQIQVISGTTVDLSGGGLMFRCNVVLKVGDLIEIDVILGEDDHVKGEGKVVRFMELPQNIKYKYAVGIEFTEITEKERDKIIKYIFKKQLELRKKGLL